MTPINFHKKEKPLTSLVSMGGGAAGMQFGGGAAGTTYIDDVFSTYVYKGNNGAQTGLGTGVDLTKGGLAWVKRRSGSEANYLFDSERIIGGVYQSIYSNTNSGQDPRAWNIAFNNNGLALNDNDTGINATGSTYVNWQFRKQEGFFDVVTYTGNGSNRTISHSLGCVPGLIMIKNVNAGENWRVYHRATKATHSLELNDTDAAGASSTPFNNTEPTANVFSVGTDGATNNNGDTIVAYLFAGGESTAATARSVDFDGSDDQLNIPDNDAWDLGTGDFTFEMWVRSTQSHSSYVTLAGCFESTYKFMIRYSSPDIGTGWSFFPTGTSDRILGQAINDGQWHHLAVVRDGTKISTYTDGKFNNSITSSGAFNAGANAFEIGHRGNGEQFNGEISNLRLVKGTAVYTSTFRPSYKPLENITNTVLLCCNNSSATGSTVTPGTITANGGPTASTDSPFDDPDGFKFGEEGDQNIVKTGSYVGNGSTNGPEVYIGWEPQWVLIKNASATEGWRLFDTMRGIATNRFDTRLFPNNTDGESAAADYIDLTSTGFKLKDNGGAENGNGNTMTYIAIRRPDGLVGKPAEAGTDVFAMDAANGSATIPDFDSGFPVDWALMRTINATENWHSLARMTGTEYMFTDTTAAGTPYSSFTFDSNLGWGKGSWNANYQSWMWKRGAGFDVVTYNGNGVTGRQMPHSLGVTPEMMWVKRRNANEHWYVYHKGVNGGTNPADYMLYLDTDSAKMSHNPAWAGTLPNSTSFTLGADTAVNSGGTTQYVAMLFATVPGISKCGYYTGNGSSRTISDVGFQPRFLIIKKTSSGTGRAWYVLDTVRGWGAGNDNFLELDKNGAQSSYDLGAPTPTGFTLTNNDGTNGSGNNYIYYAHA